MKGFEGQNEGLGVSGVWLVGERQVEDGEL